MSQRGYFQLTEDTVRGDADFVPSGVYLGAWEEPKSIWWCAFIEECPVELNLAAWDYEVIEYRCC